MSHDRGCYKCYRDQIDYDQCMRVDCVKKKTTRTFWSEVMPRYSLIRESDGTGDSGPMCEILDAENYQPIPDVTYPRVGCGVRVGSPYGRTFSSQDWWQTSPVTEILQETIDDEGYRAMKFKTRSSTYIWKEFA